jgi:hypothetical protein
MSVKNHFMTKPSKAKIFLASERGVMANVAMKQFQVFNYGHYQLQHKEPIGDIYMMNEVALDGGKRIIIKIDQPTYIFVLPVIGAIEIPGHKKIVAAGQALCGGFIKGSEIEIVNPFNDACVKYIAIGIRAGVMPVGSEFELFGYDVNGSIDSLLQVFPPTKDFRVFPFSISIGKFNGRGETTYHVKTSRTALLLMCIEGAFEVEGRLMQEGDTLAVWDLKEAEIEALSNDALLLLIETVI